jgi:hypothetical protein
MKIIDHNIVFFRKTPILSLKIGENCDHNIDPGVRQSPAPKSLIFLIAAKKILAWQDRSDRILHLDISEPHQLVSLRIQKKVVVFFRDVTV